MEEIEELKKTIRQHQYQPTQANPLQWPQIRISTETPGNEGIPDLPPRWNTKHNNQPRTTNPENLIKPVNITRGEGEKEETDHIPEIAHAFVVTHRKPKHDKCTQRNTRIT